MSRRLTAKQERAIASHEAGHCCIHLLHGVTFDHVWITDVRLDPNTRQTQGAVEGISGRINKESLQQYGIEIMAGLAGEKVAFDKKCGRVKMSDNYIAGDLENLVNHLVARKLGVKAETFIEWYENDKFNVTLLDDDAPEVDYVGLVNWCLQEAYSLLTQHRELHTRLVDALIERGRLNYDDCLAIFEQVQETGQSETVAAAVGA